MYRILLVDDDPHILKTNEAFLKKQGYEFVGQSYVTTLYKRVR